MMVKTFCPNMHMFWRKDVTFMNHCAVSVKFDPILSELKQTTVDLMRDILQHYRIP